mmetsp:Transcript_35301/g.39364  ORF Transcript_35301/g.39364 Transcript_35301/m.39364 type:complete len:231 (+) Transcript_35301:734-1426(+)
MAIMPVKGIRRCGLPGRLNWNVREVARFRITALSLPLGADASSMTRRIALCRYWSWIRKRSAGRPVWGDTVVLRTVPTLTSDGGVAGVCGLGLGTKCTRTHCSSIRSSNVFNDFTTSSPLPITFIKLLHVPIPGSTATAPSPGGGRSFASLSSSVSSVPLSALAKYNESLCSTSFCNCPGAQPEYPTHTQKSSFSAKPAETRALASSREVYDTPLITRVDTFAASSLVRE